MLPPRRAAARCRAPSCVPLRVRVAGAFLVLTIVAALWAALRAC